MEELGFWKGYPIGIYRSKGIVGSSDQESEVPTGI
jgi:hypothetical protein